MEVNWYKPVGENNMSITSMEGGILVSKSTLLRLINSVVAKPLDSNSTLFDAGVEEQKRKTAEMLKQEFKIETGFNPARDMMIDMKKKMK